MSVALTAVVRTKAPQSPEELLARLIKAVDRLPDATGEWSGLAVRTPAGVHRDGGPDTRRSGAEVRLLLPELAERERTQRVGRRGRQTGRVPARVPAVRRVVVKTGLRCWPFPRVPDRERSPMGLFLAAWDAVAAGDLAFGGDEREDGSASLTLEPVWPFRVGDGEVSDTHRARVVENTEVLVRLVEALVTELAPVSIRLHTDDGPPLPFNAHLAYYADVATCRADLDWIDQLWRYGSPRRRLAPLREATTRQLSWTLHEWRSADQREKLRARLGLLVDVWSAVGRSQIEDVLEAGSCKAWRYGTGFAVLGAPPGAGFIDGFIDSFFTELAVVTESDDASR